MLGNVLERRELEDGGFYYVSWHDEVVPSGDACCYTWYLKDGALHSPINYQCTRDGSKWCFMPLILDNVETYEKWIVEKGDIRGQLAWENYKAKLRMRELNQMKDMERKEEEEVKMDNDVDLYNPKFVHFDWDEDLKGKKGFFAGDIGTIKKELHYKGPCMMGTLLHYSDSESRPFVVKFQGGSGEWRFFYYDPNFEIKWAYFKEGKTIQVTSKDNTTIRGWWDMGIVHEIDFFDDDQYIFRIKPEEPKTEVEVKIQTPPSVDKINIVVNGKVCTFDNVEDARKVLGLETKEDS